LLPLSNGAGNEIEGFTIGSTEDVRARKSSTLVRWLRWSAVTRLHMNARVRVIELRSKLGDRKPGERPGEARTQHQVLERLDVSNAPLAAVQRERFRGVSVAVAQPWSEAIAFERGPAAAPIWADFDGRHKPGSARTLLRVSPSSRNSGRTLV
jgi:hypothetical protein